MGGRKRGRKRGRGRGTGNGEGEGKGEGKEEGKGEGKGEGKEEGRMGKGVRKAAVVGTERNRPNEISLLLAAFTSSRCEMVVVHT